MSIFSALAQYLIDIQSLCAVSIPLLLLFYIFYTRPSRTTNHFPGPGGAPISGVRIPKKKPWETFASWGRQYGAILSFSVFGKHVVVLNYLEDVNELFNKRSDVFSNRPFKLMGYLTGFDRGLTFLSPGERFRKTRKYLHMALNVQAAKQHHPLQEKMAREFTLRLLDTSAVLSKEIRRLVASTMLDFCLGYHVESDDDPMMLLSDRVAKNAGLILTAGKYWIEFLPFLRFTPFSSIIPYLSPTVSEFRGDLKRMLFMSEEYVQSCMQNPDASPSFSSRLLANPPDGDISEHKNIVHYASVSIYGGAADTTIAAIETFFLSMLLHPQIQLRAQFEIDTIVGPDRVPTLAHRKDLPYVEAILTELLRWNPPIPITSRYITQDGFYHHGYLIPRGANVVANIWGMTHDSDRFTAPHEFRPERYLDTDTEGGKNAAKDVYSCVFGFGRRVCPGRHFATSSIWIAICTILSVYSISAPGSDGDGGEKKPLPVLDCEEGALIRVLPFECRLEVRSSKAVELLRNEIK